MPCYNLSLPLVNQATNQKSSMQLNTEVRHKSHCRNANLPTRISHREPGRLGGWMWGNGGRGGGWGGWRPKLWSLGPHFRENVAQPFLLKCSLFLRLRVVLFQHGFLLVHNTLMCRRRSLNDTYIYISPRPVSVSPRIERYTVTDINGIAHWASATWRTRTPCRLFPTSSGNTHHRKNSTRTRALKKKKKKKKNPSLFRKAIFNNKTYHHLSHIKRHFHH